jgi:hypothetical protein
MSELPTHDLELRAADERRRLQNSLEELKGRVHQTLDVRQNLRRNVLLISGVTAAAALTLGYGIAGIFSPVRVR